MKVLGVTFLTGTADAVVAAGLRGGLVVIPSAPVLVRMTEDAAHREALLNADMAITDSGLMVLLWRLLKREKLERVSGLEYLKLLLEKLASSSQPSTPAEGGTFWVMPTEAARDRNLAWLRANGHATTAEDCYLAPRYPTSGPLADPDLLALIRQRQPAHIILCIGGGVQERLGYFLKRELEKDHIASSSPLSVVPSAAQGAPASVTSSPVSTSSSELSAPPLPGIHCVGAAIGFLTGDQVRIPMWVDYLYLGWLWRCVSAPRLYFPRYWKAVRLVGLMWRYGSTAPDVAS